MASEPCIEVDCKGKTWCPVTCTATLVGRKWHPVIVHRLLHHDEMRFNELKRDVGGITSKVLSDSLQDLEEKGLVHREVVSEKPVQVTYRLTQVGEALEPVIEAMDAWGRTYLTPPPERNLAEEASLA